MVRELNFDREKPKRRNLLGEPNPNYNVYQHKTNYQLRFYQNKIAKKIYRLTKSGKIPSLKKNNIPCIYCGARATRYDHRNYNKPLEVDPVCARCNRLLPRVFSF